MALKGINSYNNLYNSSFYTNMSNNGKNSSGLLQKAYASLAKSGSVSSAARAASKAWLKGSENTTENDASSESSTGTSADNAINLRNNSASMRTSAFNAVASAGKSDEDFIASVKAFAENYNSTVKTLQKSDNYIAVSSGINMVNTTNSYAGSLKRAGITLNDDNTLSVDEETMKKNITTAKQLFDGNYSYGGKMMKKASNLQTIANFSSSNGAGLYNRNGLYF